MTTLNFSTSYEITEEAIKNVSNPFLRLDGIKAGTTTFRFLMAKYDQVVLQQIYEALKNEDNDALFNLMLLGSFPEKDGSGKYRVASKIEKITDENDNVTYKLVKGTGTVLVGSAGFTKDTAVEGMAVQNLALVVMFGAVSVQKEALLDQMSEIIAMNTAMIKNNKMLLALTTTYEKAYAAASARVTENYDVHNVFWGLGIGEESKDDVGRWGALSSINGVSMENLQDYLICTVRAGFSSDHYRDSHLRIPCGHYGKTGIQYTGSKWKEYVSGENIDIKEQGCLSAISNQMEAVRMYGDKLSADSQMMTTKMNQYMQNANTCISTCSQVVKSLGNYYNTVIANIR